MSGVPRPRMRGRKNWAAKLTEEKVREIRRWRKLGRTRKQIATHLGISMASINGVLYDGHWGWVK